MITISSQVEIGLANGTVHRFGPGHVKLAEDLTADGHTTRVIWRQTAYHGGRPIGINGAKVRPMVAMLARETKRPVER